MYTIPMQITSLLSVPELWLYESKQYIHIVDGVRQNLPTIHIKYKEILEDLKIPYCQTSDCNILTFWNPQNYKTEISSLPLYISSGSTYKFIKKYTGKVIAPDSITAAHELNNQVILPRIEEFNEKAERNKLISDLSFILAEKQARGINSKLYDFSTDPYRNMELTSDSKHLMVFPVYALMSESSIRRWNYYCSEILLEEEKQEYTITTRHIAIFDLTKIEKGSSVKLVVPFEDVGLYIGRGAWQVKKWAKELGVARINVVGEL